LPIAKHSLWVALQLSPWMCNAVVTAKLPYLPVLVKLL
jgi:hypothetical protein